MNILFLFNQGSEIRQFLYSGVISELSKEHNIYVSLRIKNKEVISLFDNDNVTILDFYKKRMPLKFNIINRVLNQTTKNWQYFKNEVKFRSKIHFIIYNFIYVFLLFISKINFVKKTLDKYLINFDKKFKSEEWENSLRKNQIDELIINVPNVNYDLLYSCTRLNIPVKLLFHTNKDIYTLGKIFFPYANVAVWNKKMKEEFLLINSNFKEEQVSIVGCSHFSYLARKSSITDEYFLEKFAIAKNDKILLYIAAAPFVVEGEYEFIRLIEKSLKELHIKDYKIIIKTNPMDSRGYWDEFKSKNIEIYKSDWVWNEKEAFNYPTLNELKLFNKVLEKVDLCIGLPSTVSIEAAIKKTPNLNICFDYKNVKSIYKNIVDMWNAPFYKNTRENGAIPVFNEKELIEELELCLLKGKSIFENQKKYIESEITYDVNQLKTRTLEFIRKKI